MPIRSITTYAPGEFKGGWVARFVSAEASKPVQEEPKEQEGSAPTTPGPEHTAEEVDSGGG